MRIAVAAENDATGDDRADALYAGLSEPLGARGVIDESNDAPVELTIRLGGG